jgi:outer membrane protein assembly factor BamB
VKWKLQLQKAGTPAYAFNNPVIKGDTMYFGATDGNFYALDIDSGYMRWVFKTDGAINSVPYADDRYVYFGSNDGKAYAVRQEDGTEVWSYQTNRTIQSTFIGEDDLILFTSDAGATYLFSPEGELVDEIPNPVWFYHAFQVHDDIMYFAPGPPQNPRSLGALDLNYKNYLWTLDQAVDRATWYSFPAVNRQLVFCSTSRPRGGYWEFDYYAIDRTTGARVWQYQDESRWGRFMPPDLNELFEQNMKLLDYMAPSLWRDLVIYTSGDTVVRAFNSRSGTLAWEQRFDVPTSSAPTVAGDRVYVGLREGTNPSDPSPSRIVCLSAANGDQMWELETEGDMLNAPVIAGKWLVFGTDEQYFYVLEELY